MSLVSIVIATYNRSKLLKECLESLLSQTYRDIELIVVDDGSTDDTQAMVSRMARKHSNIRFYPRPHLGLPATRNFGLERAHGEFICFFDSDDIWPPDYIEIMVRNLQANPDFDAAYSKIKILANDETNGQFQTIDKLPSGHITADIFLRSKAFNLPSSTVLRKNAFNGIFWGESTGNCDDFDVFLRISTKSKFLYVPEICMMYRKTEDSITASARRKLFTYHMYVMERFYFKLGGDLFVPRKLALHKISHLYRNLALKHYRMGNRRASIVLLKKALYFLPLDLRLYLNLLRAYFLNSQNDKMPDWQMPPALPVHPELCCRKNIRYSAAMEVQYIPS
jgi:glycosyltransferase involved in cell wall biosynthesis